MGISGRCGLGKLKVKFPCYISVSVAVFEQNAKLKQSPLPVCDPSPSIPNISKSLLNATIAIKCYILNATYLQLEYTKVTLR